VNRPALVVDTVVKEFGPFQALKGVSFTAERGEFVVLVGPSGCGKSTLLRIIAGLEDMTYGAIEIGGKDVSVEDPSRRGVAMVFQNYALYPHMTVRENMAFSLSLQRRPKTEIDAAVQRAARVLRMEDQLEKRPKELSGGQKQRAAIGRAITRSPEIFLFDEPLSNLDAALRSQMRVELSRLHSELGSTMVYVTHDQTEAMTMATKIVVMQGGNIEQVGSPMDLYTQPLNRFVAGFLGSPKMNFLKARVKAVAGQSVTVDLGRGADALTVRAPDLSGSLKVDDSVCVGIRPEALLLSQGTDGLAGEVHVVERLGRETILFIRSADAAVAGEDSNGYVSVLVSEDAAVSPQQLVRLTLNPDQVYIFADDAGGRCLVHPRPAH
jgi:multiple sugar transport system ATP-binding protein